MDLYQLKLRQASFKGVRFDVRESDYTGGRRVVLHEYPRRDLPYVEDLGRATREYSLTAYICGVDYIERTKKLMKALESEGSGKLIHPWLGELTVVPTVVGTATFSESLGLATVDLAFVEAGTLQNPSSTTNWLKELRTSVDKLMDDAANRFAEAIQLNGVQDFVIEASETTWNVASSILCNDTFLGSLGVANKILTIPSRLMAVNPKQFATSVVSAMGIGSFVGTFNNWRDLSVSLSTMSRDKRLEPVETEHLVLKSSDKIMAQNQNAINDFVRTIAVAQAAGCASIIGTEEDSDEALSYEDVIGARDKILDDLDMQAVYTESDVVSESLETVRTALFYDLTERARDNARLITLNAVPRTPLVVVAYNQYEDAERADEIAKMNNVHHIGFSPNGGLKALSR